MKTITVREEFLKLKEFTSGLPQTFDRLGQVIHNSRNVIKKISTAEGTFVVKHFKGMYFFNRLAYSLFRKSKAARSYLYSQILNEKGIFTPPHVGWVDCYALGLLTRSYFVSLFDPHRTLAETIQYYDIYEPDRKESLYQDLAAFVFRLHHLGIYHEDLSIGNILVIRTVKGYDFTLVDLNRIKFHPVDFKMGLRNFTTLRMHPADLNQLIAEYARLSGQRPEPSIDTFWEYEKRKSYLRRLRRRIRNYTVKPLERLMQQAH
jgi:hypothetical protein